MSLRVHSDNTTAVAYINHMGGTKALVCDKEAHSIWCWCEQRNIQLVAVHIPGVENVMANSLSREMNDNTEWQLHPAMFKSLQGLTDPIDVDVFASRLNNQLPCYASSHPDPGASFVDALQHSWAKLHFMLFLPLI